jgi:alkanesulfonate monooxygenase SsuD/methylene tetrahydromethanopterin reductase-like flavin-dependent oxidoreductase (luciferase family)
MIAGRTAATLRVVARHADLWNVAGRDIADCIERSALLDRYCAEIGRDPASIVRSAIVRLAYDDATAAREQIRQARAAGFRHFALSLPAPFPEGVAQWVASEVIRKAT